MLEGLLKAGGFEVSIAADAMQAVMLAVRKPPDALILDIGMPGGGGFQVLDRLKASTNKKLNNFPIIVLSGLTDPLLAGGSSAWASPRFFETGRAGQVRQALTVCRLPRVDDMAGT
jgi:CheY-like chemotaxis protein